jgi:hypothetical protein
MNLSHLSQSERKAWLLSNLEKGVFASITWNTAKSGLTTRRVKHWIENALVSGDRKLVMPNAVAHKPEYVTVVDMEKYNNDHAFPWANVNVNTLVSVTVNKKEYTFN